MLKFLQFGFLLGLVFISSGTRAAKDSSEEGEKLRVQIFLESLCGDTIRFFNQQIKPNYERVQNCVNMEYIPFGKASYTRRGGKVKFECQHGPRECAGNKVMACAIDVLHGKQNEQTDMLVCMFGSRSPHLAGEACANKFGFDWDKMQECIEGREGDELLVKHGDKTLKAKPAVNFIPWITINEMRSKAAYKNFADTVCEQCPGGC